MHTPVCLGTYEGTLNFKLKVMFFAGDSDVPFRRVTPLRAMSLYHCQFTVNANSGMTLHYLASQLVNRKVGN